MASVWASGGGYIDFESIVSYKAHGISLYWGSGTALSLVILTTAVLFIIAEWCSQSHLSTVDYDAAIRGLKRTRSWKRYTVWLRQAPDAVIEGVVIACWAVVEFVSKRERSKHGRRSLIWSADIKHRQRTPSVIIHGVSVSEAGGEEDIWLLNTKRTQGVDIPLQDVYTLSPLVSRAESRSSFGAEPTAASERLGP